MEGRKNHLAHRRMAEDDLMHLLQRSVAVHQVGALLCEVGRLYAHDVGSYEHAVRFAEDELAESVGFGH